VITPSIIQKEKLTDGSNNVMLSVVKDKAKEEAVKAIDRAKTETEVKAKVASADEKEKITR
jgi:hypothetical protein